ncbi:MAG: glycosyltransferase family 4 protein [Bacteroidota bacterium]
MKIALIHQYFKTPEDGGGIRSYYIANHLSQLGHEVHVITAYNDKKYSTLTLNGYTVHRLPIYYSNHLSFWSRIHAFWLFAYQAYRVLRRIKNIKLNYVISTPLTTGLIALFAERRMDIPYIFEVGDLWPEAPVQLGVLKNPLLITLAKILEKKTYQRATSIVALSEPIKQYIAKIAQNKSIEVITNMADTDFFRPSKKLNQEKFTIGYLGTFGLANHLEYLVDAIKVAPANVEFILMGSGAQYQKIRSLTQGLNQVVWEEEGNKEKVRTLMAKCDAIYISFHHAPILATGCPNKLFDGLAAGKFIIANFGGWVKELIESENCGFSYDPRYPNDLFRKLAPFIRNPDQLKTAQKKAVELAQQSFTPDSQLKKLEQFMIICKSEKIDTGLLS